MFERIASPLRETREKSDKCVCALLLYPRKSWEYRRGGLNENPMNKSQPCRSVAAVFVPDENLV